MLDQALFSDILARKLKSSPLPIRTSEIHSVDEVLSPEFKQVFGNGGTPNMNRGFRAYGIA